MEHHRFIRHRLTQNAFALLDLRIKHVCQCGQILWRFGDLRIQALRQFLLHHFFQHHFGLIRILTHLRQLLRRRIDTKYRLDILITQAGRSATACRNRNHSVIHIERIRHIELRLVLVVISLNLIGRDRYLRHIRRQIHRFNLHQACATKEFGHKFGAHRQIQRTVGRNHLLFHQIRTNTRLMHRRCQTLLCQCSFIRRLINATLCIFRHALHLRKRLNQLRITDRHFAAREQILKQHVIAHLRQKRRLRFRFLIIRGIKMITHLLARIVHETTIARVKLLLCDFALAHFGQSRVAGRAIK